MANPYAQKHPMAEIDALLSGEGMLHEVETKVIDGRVQRVFKNLWPNMRTFFFWATDAHEDKTAFIFDGKTITYNDIRNQAIKAAAVFKSVYHIRKGDRIGIASRNNTEYVSAWFGAHLIGAVPTCINSFLPLSGIRGCVNNTGCKLLIVDPIIASLLEPGLASMPHVNTFLVVTDENSKKSWSGMSSFNRALDKYQGDLAKIIDGEFNIDPEDNASILFTSGTTGTPKGVLQSQRAFLSVIPNSLAPIARAMVKDEKTPPDGDGPQRGCVIVTPMFHITAFSILMNAFFMGLKIVLMKKWVVNEAVSLIKEHNVISLGAVPSVIMDLLDTELSGHPIDGVTMGGSAVSSKFPSQAKTTFPTASLAQVYGSTETMATCVGIAGSDYVRKPASTGVACPLNDILIVSPDGVAVPTGDVGEIWLRGSNVMKGYWNQPEETAKTMTKDGWYKTGDAGYLDEEGFLFIKDRIKDIIIRGGENVDSIAVENALYEADSRILEVAAIGVPDKRLGELVTAAVFPKPQYAGQVSEAELLERVTPLLPKFAVPVMIIVLEKPMEHTASGKIMKPGLRALAAKEWTRRQKKAGSKAKSKL
ncbi:hypothetical protein DL96DRAFT_1621842 [Flagelloscypha sp. PMI_526]|nr:hypothetical protein DL96DRAFT_1621842 [Flagelloscypha sp. PMI_526]